VHPEAAFVAGYALALLAIAAGVEWLGRRPTRPWASRVLAAGRAPDEHLADDGADWPHSEVPVFHLGLSGVVLAAAWLLTAVSVARHHDPIELLVQVVLLGLVTWRIVRLMTRTPFCHRGHSSAIRTCGNVQARRSGPR
jgi:hypothetical protein